MGKIYSTSYFHYTRDLNTLIQILQNGFIGSFCREDFQYKKQLFSLHIPMVSFCDLPLSQITNITYGNYAIGMTSVWGNKENLTPVCYYPKLAKNPLTKYISNQAHSFYTGNITARNATIVAYAKPKNKYITNGHPSDNYKEKECRRVLSNSMLTAEPQDKQCPALRLKFTEKDISFIIVANENDRMHLLSALQTWTTIGGNQLTNQWQWLLCTKILTKKDVCDNF